MGNGVVDLTNIVYVGNDKWCKCLESILGVKGLTIIHVFIPKDSVVLRQICLSNGLSYTITQNVNDNYEDIVNLDFELFVVIGHPFLLKKKLLTIADGIGFHPSMLPKRRGRAPINWAIIDGLEEIGVTIFHLDEGVDSGNIIFQHSLPIDYNDTAKILVNKISDLLVENLTNILLDWPDVPSTPQINEEVSYTRKRIPSDGEISREMSASEAARLVRALNGPYPSAYIVMDNGDKLYINEASEYEFD